MIIPGPSEAAARKRRRRDMAAILGLGTDSFFEPARCVGAFASWDPTHNWLAGWSALFPLHVGESPRSAALLPVDGVSRLIRFTTGCSIPRVRLIKG